MEIGILLLAVVVVAGLAGFINLASSYLAAQPAEQAAPTDRLPNKARQTHVYICGQSGTGKSKFLEGAALNDILGGEGVCVVDPHGSLVKNILLHLAKIWEQQPELRDDLVRRLVVIDPANLQNPYTPCFNPLESLSGIPTHRLATFLSDVVIKLWNVDPTGAPRMMSVLLNTFLALAELNLTLLELPKFLRDRTYRMSLINQMHNEEVRDFFTQEFPESPAMAQQWVAPVLHKIGRLVFDPEVRLLFARPTTLSFRQLMDEHKVLLVNLAKGELGEAPSSLLGAFVVASIQQAALSRPEDSSPFYLYLDEFQNYSTDNIKEVLAESRKFNLSLTMAHQYLEQLPSDIKHACLNIAGTVITFRIGYHNASQLVHELFPGPDFLAKVSTIQPWMILARIIGVPLPLPDEAELTGWDKLTLLLAHLPNRTFVVRRRPEEPTYHKTFDVPTPAKTPELLQAGDQLLLESGKQYGRLKDDVRKELSRDTGTPRTDSRHGSVAEPDAAFYEPKDA